MNTNQTLSKKKSWKPGITTGLILIVIFLSPNLVLACVEPLNSFAFEALVNKPEINYNLDSLINADNVTIKTKETPINPLTGKKLKIKEIVAYANGTEVKVYDSGTTELQEMKTVTEAIIYRSHHNKDIAVILSEVNEENLRGLSVKLQVPVEFAKISYPVTTIDIRTEIKEGNNLLNIDEEFLKSLGYEVKIGARFGEREALRATLKKGNINMGIDSIKIDYREEYDEDSDDPDDYRNYSEIHNSVDIKIKNESLTPELEQELREVLLSIGITEEEWNNPRIKITEMAEDIDTEALDEYVNGFDFKTAIKVELEWLRDNKIISGLSDSDIQKISSATKAGLSGYNSRIVWEDGWKSYHETGNLLLRSGGNYCGGYIAAAGDLPEGEVSLLHGAIEHTQDENFYWKIYIIIVMIISGLILLFVLVQKWKKSIM